MNNEATYLAVSTMSSSDSESLVEMQHLFLFLVLSTDFPLPAHEALLRLGGGEPSLDDESELDEELSESADKQLPMLSVDLN